MKPSGIITLTTDFGYRDPFVGQMKGVILSIAPKAVIVDISHDIGSHDIEEGGFILASSYPYFPKGTIHIVVVDPAVGTERRAVIIFSERHFFIGPDNGIFSQILINTGNYQAVQLANDQYALSTTGVTFHGRDLFAPAAAWLLKGRDMVLFGPSIGDIKMLAVPQPVILENGISGQVMHIDKFGNAITNIRRDATNMGRGSVALIQGKHGLQKIPMAPNYAAAKSQNLCGLFNSSGYLELFVNQESATALYGIRKGDKVSISLSPFYDDPSSGY